MAVRVKRLNPPRSEESTVRAPPARLRASGGHRPASLTCYPRYILAVSLRALPECRTEGELCGPKWTLACFQAGGSTRMKRTGPGRRYSGEPPTHYRRLVAAPAMSSTRMAV